MVMDGSGGDKEIGLVNQSHFARKLVAKTGVLLGNRTGDGIDGFKFDKRKKGLFLLFGLIRMQETCIPFGIGDDADIEAYLRWLLHFR